jgi:hypothetical protein
MQTKKHVPTVEELRQRLGPGDPLQIRLLLRVPPEQRLATMLRFQRTLLKNRFHRLCELHPKLSNLETCYLMFEQLKRSDSYAPIVS